MRKRLAAAAMALGLGWLDPAWAQDGFRVDVETASRVVCDWTERTEQKATGPSAPFPPLASSIDVTRNASIIAFGRDGRDLLVSDADPQVPADTVFLRFAPGGVIRAAAYDQGSLQQFAAASRNETPLMDWEAQGMGHGLYEAVVDGRSWALGDPLYSPEHLQAWADYLNASIPNVGITLAIDSKVELAEVLLSAEGRQQLVFAGPIMIAPAPSGFVTANGVSFQIQVQVRAVIDQATGHLVELRETSRTSGGDPATVMTYTTTNLTGVCRSQPTG